MVVSARAHETPDEAPVIPYEQELKHLATLVPFLCFDCEHVYEDAPPAIVVVLPTGTELPFCTDSCATNAGFPDAAEARWHAKAQEKRDHISIVYRVK